MVLYLTLRKAMPANSSFNHRHDRDPSKAIGTCHWVCGQNRSARRWFDADAQQTAASHARALPPQARGCPIPRASSSSAMRPRQIRLRRTCSGSISSPFRLVGGLLDASSRATMLAIYAESYELKSSACVQMFGLLPLAPKPIRRIGKRTRAR